MSESGPPVPGTVAPMPRALALLLTLAAAALLAPAAQAGVANSGLPGAPADPLAGLPWGNYTGPQDEVFPAYRAATGRDRQLLGLIALRPRVRWFGAWYPSDQIEQTVAAYIANATGANPGALAQVAVFRLVPWEGAACRRVPTAAQQAAYRQWIQAFAAGIGASRVALILQPDLPFALCAPHHSKVALSLVAEAAQVFDALPHTTVYIDAGAADWPTVRQDVDLLKAAGVAGTRGFALNATHYDSTAREIAFGAKVVRGLAAAGIPGRHFVINTAANGRPFTYQQYHGPDFDNAAVCRSRRWGLPAADRALAAREVDAYLWYGRPWLDNQADPFDLTRSLALAATTPF